MINEVYWQIVIYLSICLAANFFVLTMQREYTHLSSLRGGYKEFPIKTVQQVYRIQDNNIVSKLKVYETNINEFFVYDLKYFDIVILHR